MPTRLYQKVYSIRIRIKTQTKFVGSADIHNQKVYSIRIRIKTQPALQPPQGSPIYQKVYSIRIRIKTWTSHILPVQLYYIIRRCIPLE